MRSIQAAESVRGACHSSPCQPQHSGAWPRRPKTQGGGRSRKAPKRPRGIRIQPPGPGPGHVFAKGLVLLPLPPQHSAHPSRPWAQWSNCCVDSEGLALPRIRGQSQLLCPRSIHIVAGFSPSQDPWCHGTETSKCKTDNQEGGRQADRTGLGDHEQTTV